MKWIKRTINILLILLLALGGAVAQARENPVGFFVRPLLPSNQTGDGVGYFSLLVKPGQEQTLQVLIKNLDSEEIQVSVEANTASTNQNGIIEYKHSITKDPSLVVDFEQCVTIDEPILTIPANGSATAEFHLQIPDDPFEGDILGGLLFTRVPDKAQNGTETDEAVDGEVHRGLQIKNVFMYCVAVHLMEGEQGAPNFEVTAARMGSAAGFPAMMLDIRNPQALIAGGIVMDVQVISESSGESVLSYTSSIAMAPNTEMTYRKLLKDEPPLKTGDYRVEVKLSYDVQTWAFEVPLIAE